MRVSDVHDDIGNCLTSLGIEKRHIIPTNFAQKALRRRPDFNQFRNEFNIFPLEWFDDDDSTVSRHCNEGFTFLRIHDTSPGINPDEFEWRKVTVEKFNETANKWLIKELNSNAIYEVPGIYLLLNGENPFKFAQRIQRATQLRYECENRLKFDAAVDGIILSEIPLPPQRLRDNIRKLLFCSFSKGWIQILDVEHAMLFQKTLAAMELIKSLERDPLSFPSIQLPTIEGRRLKNLKVYSGMGRTSFKISRDNFQRLWLYCCPEAIKIMETINNDCDVLSRMSLFHIHTDNARSLMGFVNSNNEMLSMISDFLQRKWIEDVTCEVRRQLRAIGKGWFDLNVNDWGIYRMSKLQRLIELMKQRMEVAVGLMLRSSLQAFVNHLCQPCESMLNAVAVDFVWGDDLVSSCFQTPQPVFAIELDFLNDEPVFTTNLDDFETEIIKMFKSRILTTHKIPQIDPYLVTQLKFDKSLRLSSIGFLDDEIQNQIFHLRNCYQTCLIPMRSYAREYRRFADLKSRDNIEFVRIWKESDRTSKEMKEKITHQLDAIREIELTVPSTIVIGPFHVNVNSMKRNLIAKCRDLFDLLLQMFLDEVKEDLIEIRKSYKVILWRLSRICETIEELLELQEWIVDIPNELNRIQSKLQKMSTDFDVLDFFFIPLPDDASHVKASASMMPARILNKIDERLRQNKIDYEMFRKLQEYQEIQFLERIESLANDVEAFTAKHDYDDLSKVSTEINELWSVLNEMMTRGEKLNNRQKIFNQVEIDMERLLGFVERLHPHHMLLTMVSNFLQLRDDWTLAPLSTVDTNVVIAEAKRWESVLQDSRLYFTSNAEMMSLIEKISKEVEAFGVVIDVMRDLKNFDMLEEHWSILTDTTGISIKWSETITMDELCSRNILVKAQIVKEISVKATRDREQREIEELQAERKRRIEEEIAEQKKARRAVREDI